MAPIGATWVSGSWADPAWAEGTWGTSVTPPVVTGGGGQYWMRQAPFITERLRSEDEAEALIWILALADE